LKRVPDVEDPLRVRGAELRLDRGVVGPLVAAELRPPPPKPLAPISSERSAFWIDSLKVRPIAIASPTDFIDEVSVGSASGTSRR
jgi:hypothetical protein